MKFKITLSVLFTFFLSLNYKAQLADSCKLIIGTNLSGLADYGTELPFVDLMHNCRTWYSKDVNNPNGGPFDTELASSLNYRADGYPTHIPQVVAGETFSQKVSTIWANTIGWPAGQYVVLYEGTGTLSFWGGFTNLTQTGTGRIVFDLENSSNETIEMTIESSSISDPIRNIRLLMPGTELTYTTNPFYSAWLDKALVFKSFRFMDWGSTNNWGQKDPWDWDSTRLFDWSERQHMDNYTWTNGKGVPYEMMIKLMNDYNVDGWVCVPHRSSTNYIEKMAELFHSQLEPTRNLTVEYSNEIWNWMFGQTNWLHKYGCTEQNVDWPEGIVPYIQNCMDIWTAQYGNDLNRLTRAVGLQTGWVDVSQRIVFNMVPGSFDVISPTYYFGLGQEADSVLDLLGAAATVSDIAFWARYTRDQEEKIWMQEIKATIADSLNLPMAFYEGGQHLTPTPFGEEPTYAQALLDIQTSPEMYLLYDEWFDFVRTLQNGSEPLQLMNFSFVGGLSARYGSWGILESLDQDITLNPAPKYQATIDNMAKENCGTLNLNKIENLTNFKIYPNPTSGLIVVDALNNNTFTNLTIYDYTGRIIFNKTKNATSETIDLSQLSTGLYVLKISSDLGEKRFQILKN